MHGNVLLPWLVLAFDLPCSNSLAFSKVGVKRFISSALVALAVQQPCEAAVQEFDFANGHVRLAQPLILQLPDQTTLSLHHPQLLGYGGGGAVFGFDENPLVKISWQKSAASVQRECEILQYMQTKGIMHTEHCLGALPYDNDRVLIVVEPFVPNAVASIADLESLAIQTKAVKQASRFWVQMLAHGIVTIDVQPLINSRTGEVTFIDFSEAQISNEPTLVASFCAEMAALIPENLLNVAVETARDELQLLKQSQGLDLEENVQDILWSQLGL